MPATDLPIDQLRKYTSSVSRPDGFDQFWTSTIGQAHDQPLAMEQTSLDIDLKGVSTSRITFDGFQSGRISAGYMRPDVSFPVPVVVVYHGYSGRGLHPLEMYTLAAQGVAVLSPDCRGQDGESSDCAPRSFGSELGWMTQGIRSPHEYYYRYAYADAVRALEVASALDEVDPLRIAVTGVSQGGGLSLVAASLSARPIYCWADIPFLCDFPRAVQVADEGPYPEIVNYLKSHPRLGEQVFETLSYFDVVNLVERMTCPTVVTASLWDRITPPSTIFGAYRAIGSSEKEIEVLPFHGHELSDDLALRRLQSLCAALNVK